MKCGLDIHIPLNTLQKLDPLAFRPAPWGQISIFQRICLLPNTCKINNIPISLICVFVLMSKRITVLHT